MPKLINPIHKPLRRKRFLGLSLLEVIIATAILAGSGLALFSIIGMGSKYALRAEKLTYAHHFALSALDEWLASPSPIGTEQSGSFEEAPEWSYRVQSQAQDEPGLCSVTVEVFHAQSTLTSPRTISAASSEEPVYRLTRWVRVPQMTTTGEVEP
jgi:Tfp pilus assembly protein PilV